MIANKVEQKIHFIGWRFYLVITLIFVLVTGLIFRMIDLVIFKQHFLQTEGDARIHRIITTPAFRGMITDRNGYPFAVSTSVYSIWINPKEFVSDSQQIKNLTNALGLKPATVITLMQNNKNKKREFIYLKRDVSPDIANKVKALHLIGVYLQQDYKRFYPEAEVTAHVVGFTNVDDKGQEGLELAFNNWLTGVPGKKEVTKDRLGRVIAEIKNIQEQKPGNDLTLSIDRSLQYLAYRELMAGVQENRAASGSVVILDIKTGEILAMVNQPAFNPNSPPANNRESFRNRAVTDVFEPGSTIKSFSVASAFDTGLFKPDTVINTSPGWLRVGHNLVHDEHNNGPLTITQILQKSSNVGATKMILSLPRNQLWSLLHRVGFGETTEVGFPGERSGELVQRTDPFAVATLSFGYGLSVTTLQLAHAYATFANQGIKIPLSILRVDNPPAGERVMDVKVADQMLEVLEAVVEGGTGKAAHIPGYRVAGKTGTAWIVGSHGYEKHRYTSSFVGIAPVSHPRFVVAVIIRDPLGKHYYAEFVSAPIFKKIMEGALRMSNVSPDDVS